MGRFTQVASAQLSDAQQRETRRRPLSTPALADQIRSNLRRGLRCAHPPTLLESCEMARAGNEKSIDVHLQRVRWIITERWCDSSCGYREPRAVRATLDRPFPAEELLLFSCGHSVPRAHFEGEHPRTPLLVDCTCRIHVAVSLSRRCAALKPFSPGPTWVRCFPM
jgi:hypothetical protein